MIYLYCLFPPALGNCDDARATGHGSPFPSRIEGHDSHKACSQGLRVRCLIHPSFLQPTMELSIHQSGSLHRALQSSSMYGYGDCACATQGLVC